MSLTVACATGHLSDSFREWFPDMNIIGNENNLPDKLDLLILTGGSDIHPRRYGERVTGSVGISEERDEREFEILRKALMKYPNLKVLGVCRGMQLLNVFFGGTLHQDIGSIGKNHRYAHGLSYNHSGHPLSWLTAVNSLHHQALRSLGFSGRNPYIIAVDVDHGLPETIVWDDSFLGVQFHPEMFATTAGSKFFDIVKSWVSGDVSMTIGAPDSQEFDEDELDEDEDSDEDEEENDDNDDSDPVEDVIEFVLDAPTQETRMVYNSASTGRYPNGEYRERPVPFESSFASMAKKYGKLAQSLTLKKDE